MSDLAVAVHTIEHLLRIAGMRIDAGHDLLMAADTVFLERGGIERLDHDRLVKILEREAFRMVVAVDRFARVFPDQVVRRMAIVAGRNRMVRRLQPAVVLLAHDVAVHTSLWIVR